MCRGVRLQVGAAGWSVRRAHRPTGRADRSGGSGGSSSSGSFVALVDMGMRDMVECARGLAAGASAGTEAALSPAAHCTHDLAEWEAGYIAHHDVTDIQIAASK